MFRGGGAWKAEVLGGSIIGRLLNSAQGFFFDFRTGATGAGISSISSKQPSSVTATQGAPNQRPVWTAGPPDYGLCDGLDDGLLTNLVPAAEVTVAACFVASGIGQYPVGLIDGSGNRCYVGAGASGNLGGGWAGQSSVVIKGGSSILGTTVVGLMRVNASAVELWLNGVRVYGPSAPSGTPPNTIPFGVGALRSGSVFASVLSGKLYATFELQSFIRDQDVVPLMRAIGAGVVTF